MKHFFPIMPDPGTAPISKKPWDLNLKTPVEQFNKEEHIKLNSNGMRGTLHKDFRDFSTTDIKAEADFLAKSHGIYLEFNRAKTGSEKDWFYMIRLSNFGGGPVSSEQWRLIDELAEQYGKSPDGEASIRLTTRQAIQFHWVSKAGVLKIIKTMAEHGLNSLNSCGDNIRNTTACPFSRVGGVFDPTKLAHEIGLYFQLPLQPFIEIFEIDPTFVRRPSESFDYGTNLLNKKCKIGISGAFLDPETGEVKLDNGIELKINEIGVAPIVNDQKKVTSFQIYLGGGQGERNGKPSLCTLGKPFCQVSEQNLIKTLDAIMRVHKEWSDRSDRQFTRMKYIVKKQGVDWYRRQTQELLDFRLLDPDLAHDPGPRYLHHGWEKQADGNWTYGCFIENGRITDSSPNGKLKSMVREIMDTLEPEMMVTANQDILFQQIPEAKKAVLDQILAKHDFGYRDGKPYSTLRKLSGSCVGMPTCRLTYTDSERFEPLLIDELEKLGWGELAEAIGVTGCERQCFRPATKSVGLVGSGMNLYQLKLMGTEDARHLGMPVVDELNRLYLRFIPRDKVPLVLDTLFRFYTSNKNAGEDLGSFNRRMGIERIIEMFKAAPQTKDLMNMALPADCYIVP